jgi:hypothetical protein
MTVAPARNINARPNVTKNWQRPCFSTGITHIAWAYNRCRWRRQRLQVIATSLAQLKANSIPNGCFRQEDTMLEVTFRELSSTHIDEAGLARPLTKKRGAPIEAPL